MTVQMFSIFMAFKKKTKQKSLKKKIINSRTLEHVVTIFIGMKI